MAIKVNAPTVGIIAIVIAVVLLNIPPHIQSSAENNDATVPTAKINDTKIKLEVAQTIQEQTKGLGYRDSLPSDTGMLFVYQNPQYHNFWMMGMRFALDFIWIEKNKVADIHENVQPPFPGENPIQVSPRIPVSYVLEVNAGFIKTHNIKIGDSVILNL